MPDPRFFIYGDPISAEAAAEIAGARLARPGKGRIVRAAAIDDADIAEAFVFAEKAAAAKQLDGRAAGLCLLNEEGAAATAPDGAVAIIASPRLGFARLAARLHRERPLEVGESGVHPSARLGEGVILGRGALIGAGAEIGDRCVIGPYVAIGPGVIIGPDSEVRAAASIFCALIGARALVLAGARIGEPGFGFAPGPQGLVRIPQLGRVVIGDDVEVGANAAIDRGSLGDTEIGDGVKFDNLVHIGHNVKIGRHSVIVAQVGVSGSTTIGTGVSIAGQAGLADHLKIGDGAQIAAKSGVITNVPAGEKWGGYPARPIKKWLRDAATLSRLAETRRSKKNEHD